MRATNEPVVTGVNDDGIVGNSLGDHFVADHSNGNIDAMNLLVILRHLLVVILIVAPGLKALVLTTDLTLGSHVLAKFPAIIRRLGKLLPGIDMIKAGWRAFLDALAMAGSGVDIVIVCSSPGE